MSRAFVASALVVLGLLATIPTVGAVSAQAAAAQGTAAPLTPADAAPFLGDWALAVQGQNGPLVMNLTVKVDNAKVVAEISSEVMPSQPITNVTKSDKGLVLSYDFDYQGNPVPVVLMLTPAAEKMNVHFDFGGGAFEMSGTATKKVK